MRTATVLALVGLAAAKPGLTPNIAGSDLSGAPTLPIPGLTGVGSGIPDIAASLNQAANSIKASTGKVAAATVKLDADISANVDPASSLTQSIHEASNIFWGLNSDLQKKICSLASSFNPRTIEKDKVQVIAAAQAQVQAINKLASQIQQSVGRVQGLAGAYTDGEKKALQYALAALQQSSQQAISPAINLVNGLKGVGISGFDTVLGDVQNAVQAIGSATASAGAGVSGAGGFTKAE